MENLITEYLDKCGNEGATADDISTELGQSIEDINESLHGLVVGQSIYRRQYENGTVTRFFIQQ